MIAEECEKYVYRIPRDAYVEPKDYSKQRFSCYDFFRSVYQFVTRNFEGAITLDFPESFDGTVNISPRGFAYFLRVLLAEVFGNALVRTRFNVSDNVVSFTLSVPEDLKCISTLKAIAEKSGFSFEAENGKIILSTESLYDATLYVYAHDILKFIGYLYEVFLNAPNE